MSIDDQLTSSVRRNILAILIQSGFQITPEALDYLLHLESPLETVESIISSKISSDSPQVLSKEYVETLIENRFIPSQSNDITSDIEQIAVTVEPIDVEDLDSEWHFRIEKNPEEDAVGSEGTIENFLEVFRDRFIKIKKIYMKRIDTQNAVSPSVAKMRKSAFRATTTADGRRTKRPPSQLVLGIIRNKSISNSQNVIIDLEEYREPDPSDSEGTYKWPNESIICVIPSKLEGLKGPQLSEKANALLLDEIICLSGHVDNDERMIADDVLFPDIPTVRQIGRAEKDIHAAFISDLHCGSQEFLEEELDKFIDWLHGRDVDDSDKRMVETTKYLFIAGDLVDGISVYPNQREHLLVSSLYDQYKLIASKLKKLPKRIKIFCIPGNHDACRQALPKPPIPRIFAKPLYDLENVVLLGDPCQLIVEGVNILMTHGDSLDDLVTTLPGASYTEPAQPMKELLRKRHLAPIYGGKTELAPLRRDWMVIDTPPDVVHFGHAHHNAVDNYRGVQIINSGTFQSQTDFMRKQGVVPTPGIVTFLNLRTGAPQLKFFYNLYQ
ncbi:MAG: metallophosphoesterase [Candidatus Thorarchaeota archaeon]|nr:metallophosphoesterase [Candidatus Thorarchaeota archaeon]